MPNSQALQIFYGTIPLIATIFLAIWINNQRIGELSKRIDDSSRRFDDFSRRFDDFTKRIDDLRTYMASEIVSLREFIRSEIRRLEQRIERIEHPIVRG